MRVDSRITKLLYYANRTDLLSGAIINQQSYVTPVTAFSRSRSEITYNQESLDGWRKPSPYEATVNDMSPTKVLVTGALVPYYAYKYEMDIRPLGLSDAALNALTPTPSEVDQVLVRALNNVADRKASFAESAAEVIKTARGLASNAKSISDFALAVAKRDWRGAAKAVGLKHTARKVRRARDQTVEAGGSLGSAWLNYWFGLAPIVSDMVSIAAFLSDEAVHNKLRVNGSSQHTFPRFEKRASTYQVTGPYSAPNVEYTHVESGVGKVRVSLDYSITSASLRRLATFGATDLASTLWAIQPMSFIVDWVLPVSEILKAYTADSFLNFRGGSWTTVAEYKCKAQDPRGIPNAQVKVTSLDFIGGERMFKKVLRGVYKTSPKPVTLWIKDPFDLWKGITSLSLLASRFKSALT